MEREGDSTIIMTITMVFSDVLGFLGLIDHPFSRWKYDLLLYKKVC